MYCFVRCGKHYYRYHHRFSHIQRHIALTPAFLWVVFGIAVVFLGATALATSATNGFGVGTCVCTALTTLIIGSLGTILLSLVLLAVTFAATSVIGAIFAGLLLALFSLLITSVACLIKQLSGCDN
ncbi:MAG: hypothetical protein J6A56_01950 [Clostridia bacterium]|nr:hypothetical protein [Clostridia bacterium]